VEVGATKAAWAIKEAEAVGAREEEEVEATTEVVAAREVSKQYHYLQIRLLFS